MLRVGVLADGSSVRISSAAFDSAKNLLFGRGVVGVVSSPGRPCGGSGTDNVVLTAWKEDMLEGPMTSSLQCPPPVPCRGERAAQVVLQ